MDSSNKSLCLVLIVALSAHFLACENPVENPNSTWDPPSEWYSNPTWSPTGEWIAYEYYGIDSLWGIWLVRPDGSENHFETKGVQPDFSLDGKKLALVRGEKIFVYDLETKDKAQLTSAGNNFSPRWSPDAKKISYDSNGGNTQRTLSIWLMGADGSNKKDLRPEDTANNFGIPWGHSDWFPDFRILHSRGTERDGQSVSDIFIMDSTSTGVILLTAAGKTNSLPKASLDGKRIVWQRWDLENNNDLAVWLMNADGSGQVRLIDGFEPDWLPDNSHIIYRKRGDYVRGESYDEEDPKVHGSLWIMNVDTRKQWQFLPTD